MDFSDYHIIMPGRIVSYDPVEQLASIRISLDRVFSESTEPEKIVGRDPIVDVPVFTPSGGGWSLTFPIKAGDTCLMLFSQFGYDHWLFDNKDSAGVRIDGNPMPWTKRVFSLSDGLAIVGFNTIPQAIADYHADDSEWRNDNADQKIALKVDGTIELNSLVGIVLNAPTVTINGNLVTNGTGTFSGDVTAESISVAHHIHPGDGGSGSGPDTGEPL